MSYRALVTLRHEDKTFDFAVGLGGLWDQAEILCHTAASWKVFDKAVYELRFVLKDKHFCDYSIRNWDPNCADLERATWIRLYADQVWEVLFEEENGYCRVTITGKDAGGSDIFMRKTVYHIGDSIVEV